MALDSSSEDFVTAVEQAGGTAFEDCRGEWHVWLPDDAALTQPSPVR